MNKQKETSNQKTITIAGASGVVGRHLVKLIKEKKYQLRILSRSGKNTGYGENFLWNPDSKSSESLRNTVNAIEGTDILINLAGAPLSEGRLNKKLQGKILESRLDSTQMLINAYKLCKQPPRIWGQASAIGYYGDTGNNIITESSGPGNLFLSQVCVQWEKLLLDFCSDIPDLKVIIGRFGMVLATDAPAWQKIIKPVKAGIGGEIGSGNQWYSWIDADDIALAFFHLFDLPDTKKVFNFTSPDPVEQKVFVRKIARHLEKPAFVKIPAVILKLLLGKGADELLLSSCKALPENLSDTGYKFKFDSFDKEIINLLGSKEK